MQLASEESAEVVPCMQVVLKALGEAPAPLPDAVKSVEVEVL